MEITTIYNGLQSQGFMLKGSSPDSLHFEDSTGFSIKVIYDFETEEYVLIKEDSIEVFTLEELIDDLGL